MALGALFPAISANCFSTLVIQNHWISGIYEICKFFLRLKQRAATGSTVTLRLSFFRHVHRCPSVYWTRGDISIVGEFIPSSARAMSSADFGLDSRPRLWREISRANWAEDGPSKSGGENSEDTDSAP
jgi:hypothetical protein